MNDVLIEELIDLVNSTPSRTADEIYEGQVKTESLISIRLIGRTASFFGGYEGMLKLHNAFQKAGGDTQKLNRFWDMTGYWFA